MTSIFVAKLDFGVTQEELKSTFGKYGKVAKATIATDRETGRPKGFAFVEMFSEEEANEAIAALDGISINGRQIAVKKAEDRSGGKPADRPVRREYSSERPDFRKENTEQSPARSDESKIIDPSLIIPIDPAKLVDRKKDLPKKKEKKLDFNDGRPRPKKMETYKKSGKSNRFLDFDDEDDF